MLARLDGFLIDRVFQPIVNRLRIHPAILAAICAAVGAVSATLSMILAFAVGVGSIYTIIEQVSFTAGLIYYAFRYCQDERRSFQGSNPERQSLRTFRPGYSLSMTLIAFAVIMNGIEREAFAPIYLCRAATPLLLAMCLYVGACATPPAFQMAPDPPGAKR
jgi:hypothetical protein